MLPPIDGRQDYSLGYYYRSSEGKCSAISSSLERLEPFEIGADQRTRRICDREMPTDISADNAAVAPAREPMSRNAVRGDRRQEDRY